MRLIVAPPLLISSTMSVQNDYGSLKVRKADKAAIAGIAGALELQEIEFVSAAVEAWPKVPKKIRDRLVIARKLNRPRRGPRSKAVA